jgi:hypothetical protein
MKNAIKYLAGSILLAGSLGAQAAILDFEGGSVGGGFSSSNFNVLDSASSPALSNSGYGHGAVSGTHVAYNSGGSAASLSSLSSFLFTGAYFTGAWNDGLSITVNGFLGGVATLSKTFVVDSLAPTWQTFGWNVDRLSFSSAGGVDHAGYAGSGTHFALDNFTYNEVLSSVPEPETYAMFAVGLGLLGVFGRRRKSQAV